MDFEASASLTDMTLLDMKTDFDDGFDNSNDNLQNYGSVFILILCRL
jgi:hypothetical protein